MSKAKIAITLEPATIAQVRAQVRSRRSPSVSAYIASAVSARLESESMARLVADIQREHGRPSREAKAWARAVLGR
jgi:Arc/MetJ-type ribon-helix-helix transcriptional regulator